MRMVLTLAEFPDEANIKKEPVTPELKPYWSKTRRMDTPERKMIPQAKPTQQLRAMTIGSVKRYSEYQRLFKISAHEWGAQWTR